MVASQETVTLTVEHFVDREIGHLKEKMELRFDSQAEALALAMVRLNERLAEMNELRGQIATERGSYLTREAYEREHKIVSDRAGALELQASKWSGSIWMLGGVISLVVVGINILLRMWPK
jgi:hypothetical protein